MEKENKQLSKKIIFTCFLAGLLEIYDFTIFGMLSEKLKENYLVFLDSGQGLILTYALFAVGFFFRPLGAMIFGYIGDRFGRKTALVSSVTLMGTASLGFAVLPTYASIGIASCYLLVLLRIIQGISVGGEYNGAIIFAVEHSRKDKAGFVGSLVVAGCTSGILVATFVGHILKQPGLPEYAWRFAFLLGFCLSLVGFFIRKSLKETFVFSNKSKDGKEIMPLFKALKTYWLECLMTISIAATSGVNVYFISIYFPNYLKGVLQIESGYYNIVAIFIIASLIPVFGFISDKLGRIRILQTGISLVLIVPWILFVTVTKTDNPNILYGVVVLYAFIISIYSGAMNTFITEIFPSEYRYTCSAISYSLGMGLVGGSMPMVASMIKEYYASSQGLYTSAYIFFVSSLSLIILITLKNKQKIKG